MCAITLSLSMNAQKFFSLFKFSKNLVLVSFPGFRPFFKALSIETPLKSFCKNSSLPGESSQEMQIKSLGTIQDLKTKIASEIVSSKTRKDEMITAIQLNSNPEKVCLSVRDVKQIKGSTQIMGVFEFIEEVFRRAETNKTIPSLTQDFQASEINQIFSSFLKSVNYFVEIAKKNLIEVLKQIEDPVKRNPSEEFINKAWDQVTREMVEKLVTQWASEDETPEVPAKTQETDRITRELQVAIHSEFQKLTQQLKKYQPFDFKEAFESTPQRIKKLSKPYRLCAGQRGIMKCAEKAFLIMDSAGHCSRVNLDARFTEINKADMNFLKPCAISSIVPDALGKKAIASDVAGERIVFFNFQSNSAKASIHLASSPLKVVWVNKTEFLTVSSKGAIEVYHKTKKVKTITPFPDESFTEILLCPKSSKEAVFASKSGTVFRMNFMASRTVWVQHFYNFYTIDVLVLAPSGKNFLLGGFSSNKVIYLMELETGEKIGKFDDFSLTIRNIKFSPCGKFMCVLSEDQIGIYSFNERCKPLSKLCGIDIKRFDCKRFSCMQGMEVFWSERLIVVATNDEKVFKVAIK